MTRKFDTSNLLEGFLKAYRKAGSPLQMSFRDEVSWIPYNSSRFTHQIHTYPAKVIPQIPHFFLSASSFTPSNAVVVDPFSGSGTVALEACLSGKRVIASDSNPLARLLTAVKATPQCPNKVGKQIAELELAVSKCRAKHPPDVVNLNYWYAPHIVKQLTRVAASIRNLPASNFRRLSEVALSVCAYKSSQADPRVAVPVRLKPLRYPPGHPLRAKSRALLHNRKTLDAISLYFNILRDLSIQLSSLWPIRRELGRIEAIYENSLGTARNSLSSHPKKSADVVITSPPYLGAQKYVRATSLSLGWLSYARTEDLRGLEDRCIGREHYPKEDCQTLSRTQLHSVDSLLANVYKQNPLRAKIASSYIVEMRDALKTCFEILRPGGKLVLVSGCNSLTGQVFDTTRYLQQICSDLGFALCFEATDVIKSRGLMTRRNRTAGIIPLESVSIFIK